MSIKETYQLYLVKITGNQKTTERNRLCTFQLFNTVSLFKSISTFMGLQVPKSSSPKNSSCSI